MESITFILMPTDMKALHKFLAKRANAWRLSRDVLLLVVVGSFALMAWDEVQPIHGFRGANVSALLETVLLPIIVIVAFWGYFFFQFKRQPTDPLFTEPQTLSVFEKELVWQHHGAATVRQWPTITEIADDEAAIYFYVGKT